MTHVKPAFPSPLRPSGERSVRHDAAVNEVVGFIFMFAISAVILVLSLQSFLLAKTQSDDVAGAVEMKLVADEVAAHLVMAGAVASDTPNATFETRFTLPADVRGDAYRVTVARDLVWANTTDGKLTANATTFRLEQVPNVSVSGTVTIATGGMATIRYEYVPATGDRKITLLYSRDDQ